ncbi:histidine kinase dimerization/phospho-acceptor domain-containing protein [Magnetovibrio sp. PR-2]|uniref:histidine kinase dimerization/phospho-acceptor domain-containing protein n=1 Tax=Magnetovibrio sp. PR-2 TaxID=3120356 RepID=UPI002FCE47E1
MTYAELCKETSESNSSEERAMFLCERLSASPASDVGHAAFLAYMSHELRTPLTAIMGFVQVMKMHEEYPDLVDSHAEYLDRVDQSSQRLMHVTQIMLSYLEKVCETEDRHSTF